MNNILNNSTHFHYVLCPSTNEEIAKYNCSVMEFMIHKSGADSAESKPSKSQKLKDFLQNFYFVFAEINWLTSFFFWLNFSEVFHSSALEQQLVFRGGVWFPLTEYHMPAPDVNGNSTVKFDNVEKAIPSFPIFTFENLIFLSSLH